MRQTLHRFTDHFMITLLRRGKLFRGGFGDESRIERVVHEVTHYRPARSDAAFAADWDGEGVVKDGVRVRRFWFDSPLADELPEESKRALVEVVEPVGVADPPTVIVLAATNEEGFSRRWRLCGPLIRQGIAAVFLENPMYGARKPRDQDGPFVRTVSEQLAMNLASVDEGRALAAWLHRLGRTRICVTGFSQGGMMAAFAAANTTRFPIAVVPCAAGLDSAPVFTKGALRHSFDWRALSADKGGMLEAKRAFEHALAPITLGLHPPVLRPDLAILVAARHDGFIPLREVVALHRHWKGSELRWVPAGHVTSVVLHVNGHRKAIADVLDRMAGPHA